MNKDQALLRKPSQRLFAIPFFSDGSYIAGPASSQSRPRFLVDGVCANWYRQELVCIIDVAREIDYERVKNFSMKKKAALLGAMALGGAFVISLCSDTLSYKERLVQASLRERFGPDALGLLLESPELQLLFLDYSESPELVWKSRIAISKYGDQARSILKSYGVEPAFREILSNYGENVIPVIEYFIENDPISTRGFRAVQRAGQSVMERTKGLTRISQGKAVGQGILIAEPADSSFGPMERGRYAVQRIRSQGHDFLGQFAIGGDKKARWIQTERLFEGMTSFFASGIRNIETKYVLDQKIEAVDLFWAGVDTAMAVSFIKTLRALKAVRARRAVGAGEALGISGKEASFLKRTKLFARPVLPNGALGRSIFKLGAAAGLIYAIGTHPSLLNGIFAEIASFLDLNPFIVQVACWALLIFALCLPLMPLLRVVLPLLVRALLTLAWAFRQLERLLARERSKDLAEPLEPQAGKFTQV